MKSWANPDVVVVVEVVVVEVAIRINIPHVVIVVSRPEPKTANEAGNNGAVF